MRRHLISHQPILLLAVVALAGVGAALTGVSQSGVSQEETRLEIHAKHKNAREPSGQLDSVFPCTEKPGCDTSATESPTACKDRDCANSQP